MTSIRKKLLWSHAALACVTAIVLPVAVVRFTLGLMLDELEATLRFQSARVAESLGYVWSERPLPDAARARATRELERFAHVTGADLRLLDRDGTVIVNSLGSGPGYSLAGRREIQRALVGRFHSALRGPSATQRHFYVALPVRERGRVIGVAYANASVQRVWATVPKMLQRLAIASLLAFTVAFALSMVMSSAIAHPIVVLRDAASRLAAGDFTVRVQPRWEDEVAMLTRTFNAMAARLQRVDEERRTFLADVAHELRTPLTAIQGSAETLGDMMPADSAAARQFLQNLTQQTERLKRLVRDLLQLARLEGETVSMTPAAIDLRELLTSVITEMQPLATQRSVTVAAEIAEAELSGDPVHLAQVMINLLSNALRFAPTHSEVQVRAVAEEREVVITVTDRGPGIPPEALPHIFERFFRADPARTAEAGQGSGLGLAIARRIVQAHGGTIVAASELGQGTTMTVRLPLAR